MPVLWTQQTTDLCTCSNFVLDSNAFATNLSSFKIKSEHNIFVPQSTWSYDQEHTNWKIC